MIKVISFNVDGAFIDKSSFDDLFWYQEMPWAYSREHKVSVEKAKELFRSAYKEVSLLDPDWWQPEFWFKKLKMQPDEARMIKSLQGTLSSYRDTKPAIENLYAQHKYKLVAISNSSKSFLRFKFKALDLQGYFTKSVSAIDDFRRVKNDREAYRELLSVTGAKPEEVIHVGDDLEVDYDIPTSLKINAYLLDRKAKKSGTHVVHDLTEFLKKVKEFEKKS